jgi:ferrous iron transport protein B
MHTLVCTVKVLCLLVGFGCTVPAFYATRTLENDKDRILDWFAGAIYLAGTLAGLCAVCSHFLPTNASSVIFWLYLLVNLSPPFLLGIVLKNSVFKR